MSEKVKDIIRFAVEHLLWLVSCAGAFYLMLRTRATVLYGSVALFANATTANTKVAMLDKFAIVLIGVGLISCVVLVEYHYIHATSFGDLISRFMAVTGIEIVVLGVLMTLMQVVWGIAAVPTSILVLIVAQIVFGVVLLTNRLWLRRLFGVEVRQEI